MVKLNSIIFGVKIQNSYETVLVIFEHFARFQNESNQSKKCDKDFSHAK